jgi:hypothetical protein
MGTIPTPKGFIVNEIYEPDKERMLRALRIIIESPGKGQARADEIPVEEQVIQNGSHQHGDSADQVQKNGNRSSNNRNAS